MKHSIKRQMTAVFVGLIACFLLVLLIINARFLEPYYISNKKTEFILVYSELSKVIENNTVEDEEAAGALQQLTEKNNISFLVIDNANNRVVTNVYDMETLRNQLKGYLMNKAQKESRLLESTDRYEIVQSRDKWKRMWGRTDS